MKKFIIILMCIISLTPIKAQTWQTLFFDDFNRADGNLGTNYTSSPSPGITQLGILNNEVKIASDSISPAYWIVSYVNGVSDDSIRISCKFRAPVSGYGFSISARDNGVNTYRAGIMSDVDTLFIYRGDYLGNSTKLAGAKANLDVSKTYFIEFTLLSADLTCRFVEAGTTDTITINATDNLLSGNNITLSAYYFSPNMSLYFDDFKIESLNYSTGVDNAETQNITVFPNPASDMLALNTAHFNYTDLTVRIYNVVGQLVHAENIQQNQQQINIKNLKNGIYTVEIRSKEWTGKQKLIVQK